MKKSENQIYGAVLLDIRKKLTLRRGYGSRIAEKLGVNTNQVYAVAWGKKSDEKILEALMDEAQECAKHQDPNKLLVNRYLNQAA